MMATPPRIVELVGPAGAGKSTLARALSRCDKNISLTPHPYWRDPGQLPFFAWNAVTLAPTFTRMLRQWNGQPFRRSEIGWMVMLHGWHRQLRRSVSRCGNIILIDQGPISMLAAIRMCGSGVMNGSWADGWWQRMYRQWANTLDLVIWLDAPNSVLVPRVRGRKQEHHIKTISDMVAFVSLDEYRVIYGQILSALVAEQKDLGIVRFDTAQESITDLCDQVRAALGLISVGRQNGDH